ncbi:hypothetical protein SRHO_G00212260 [Serrasalmus rhombeus]
MVLGPVLWTLATPQPAFFLSLPIWWASVGGLTVSLTIDHPFNSTMASFGAPTFPAIPSSLGGGMGSTRLSKGGKEGWKHPRLDPPGGCSPSQTYGTDQGGNVP